MPYHAFISYSHAADGKLAPALQQALHRIAKPWYKVRALHIFLDQRSLSIGPELWKKIEKALDDSEYFIFLASPSASSSSWIQKEIKFWLEKNTKENFLIILTEGNIVWDSQTNDFDWNLTTALPAILRNIFSTEPNYIDFRQLKLENQLSLSDPPFLDRVRMIAATLHLPDIHTPTEVIIGEELKQTHITKWLTRSVVTILIGSLVAAVIGFYNAKQQKNAALIERFHAQAMAAIQNPGDMNGDPIHAHLLAAQAYRLQPDNPTAHKALLSTLLSSHTHQSLNEHTNDIHKVIYSSDGSSLASISDDGLILWEINQNKATKRWQDRDNSLSAVAFSPDNRQIVAASKNGELIFWDTANGNKLALIANKDSDSDENILSMVTSISFNADGTQLITAHEGGILKLWDATSRKKLKAWRAHQSGTNEAVFHPTDSKRAISYPVKSSNSDYHMRMWNLDSFKEIKKWQISTPSEEATDEPTAISPDGKRILSKYLRKLLFWNMDSDENLSKKLEMENGEILLDQAGYELFAFSSDGRQFVGNEVDVTSSMLTVNQIEFDKFSSKVTIKSNNKWPDIRYMHSLAFSPNGKQIAGGGKDGRLTIWNVSAGERIVEPWNQLNETEIDGIKDFAFNHNEKRFASIEDYSAIKVFDYDNVTEKFVLTQVIQPNDVAAAQSIAINHNGDQLLLGGTDGNSPVLELWQLSPDGQNKTFVKALSSSGNSTFKQVAFSKDNQQIFAVTEEGVLVSWKMPTFEKKETRLIGNNGDSIYRAAFSPDRKILMTVSNSHSGVRLWETATGECYKGTTENCRIQRGHEESLIAGIAVSPDGKLAVSTSEAALWVYWDVANGEVIARKQYDSDQEKRFERVFFLSDGKLLIYAWNEKWMLWDVSPSKLSQHACEVAGRSFTETEWNRFVGNDFLDYEEKACN